MARIQVYRTYRWVDKDAIIDAVKTVVQDEHLKNNTVHQISGVATATLDNWFNGSTKKPQNATITAVTSALGYVRRDELRTDGTVNVGFTKARKLNFKDEMEKQADWLIKQEKLNPKKPKKKKKNGHAG
jgi:hypothetical protein